jgi:hypothetical protein
LRTWNLIMSIRGTRDYKSGCCIRESYLQSDVSFHDVDGRRRT